MAIRYVVGYIFDEKKENVLLVKKLRPEFLAGKMNGIGGKMELYDENEAAAMSRETLEEANLNIPREDFYFITANDLPDFSLHHFFAIASDKVMEDYKNNIDEQHAWYNIEKVLNGEYDHIYADGVLEIINYVYPNLRFLK